MLNLQKANSLLDRSRIEIVDVVNLHFFLSCSTNAPELLGKELLRRDHVGRLTIVIGKEFADRIIVRRNLFSKYVNLCKKRTKVELVNRADLVKDSKRERVSSIRH